MPGSSGSIEPSKSRRLSSVMLHIPYTDGGIRNGVMADQPRIAMGGMPAVHGLGIHQAADCLAPSIRDAESAPSDLRDA